MITKLLINLYLKTKNKNYLKKLKKCAIINLNTFFNNKNKNYKNQTMSNLQKETNQTEVSQKTKSKQNFKLIGGGIAVLTILAVIVGVGLTTNRNTDDTQIAEKEDKVVEKVAEVSDSGREFFDPEKEAEQVELEEVSEEITKARDEYIDFQNRQNSLPENERVSIASLANNDFDQSEVVEVKKAVEKANIPATNREIKADEEFDVTVSYSSIGDESFQNGSLFIRLSKGLEVVSGSIVDTFNGEEIQVSDSVFDSNTRIIEYAPGSKDKSSGSIGVNDEGKLTFKVKVVDSNITEFAISSSLKENGKETGQPGFMFLEI